MKPKFKVRPENAFGDPIHYFASSIAEWHVDNDLEALVNYMKKQGFPFMVWRVDLPLNASYGIKHYTPQSPEDKTHPVGFWELYEQKE